MWKRSKSAFRCKSESQKVWGSASRRWKLWALEKQLFGDAVHEFLRRDLLNHEEWHVESPLAIPNGRMVIEQRLAICRTKNQPLLGAFGQRAFAADRLIARVAADVEFFRVPSVRRVRREWLGIVEAEQIVVGQHAFTQRW